MVTEMFPVVDSATGVSDSVGGAINDDNDTLLEKWLKLTVGVTLAFSRAPVSHSPEKWSHHTGCAADTRW